MKLGFIGTGAITTAIVTGLCTASKTPKGLVVSPRNAAKSAALAARFPQLAVAATNQAVVDDSDWVFLAVRPQVAREVLRPLRFRPEQRIVSLIATVSAADVGDLVAPATAIVRAVPLPTVARRLGPIAICPPDADVADLFDRIGTAVPVADDHSFDALWAVTGLVAPYYALVERTSRWLEGQHVEAEAAERYVGALVHALSVEAVQAGHPEFASLAKHAQTPGGLNEQALRQLTEAGWYDAVARVLDVILARIEGTAPGRARTDEPG
jgi:pyrroline-5-carboxylate reductase